MPRMNPSRSIANEANVARRIQFEREQRGWSYESTASRMTVLGCPIHASAIYKIEKGEPRRRIAVDELVGFADAFKVSVEELLVPVELVHDRAIHALLQLYGQRKAELEASVIGLHETLTEMRTLMASIEPRRQLLKLVMDGIRKISESNPGVTFGDLEADAAELAAHAAWPYPEYVGKAIERLTKSVGRWANETAEGI